MKIDKQDAYVLPPCHTRLVLNQKTLTNQTEKIEILAYRTSQMYRVHNLINQYFYQAQEPKNRNFLMKLNMYTFTISRDRNTTLKNMIDNP